MNRDVLHPGLEHGSGQSAHISRPLVPGQLIYHLLNVKRILMLPNNGEPHTPPKTMNGALMVKGGKIHVTLQSCLHGAVKHSHILRIVSHHGIVRAMTGIGRGIGEQGQFPKVDTCEQNRQIEEDPGPGDPEQDFSSEKGDEAHDPITRADAETELGHENQPGGIPEGIHDRENHNQPERTGEKSLSLRNDPDVITHTPQEKNYARDKPPENLAWIPEQSIKRQAQDQKSHKRLLLGIEIEFLNERLGKDGIQGMRLFPG